MQGKSLKRNYVLNLIYQILAVVLPFITTPYISRVLLAEGVGAYSYTLATATYMGTFAIMGMDTYGQLQASKCRNDKTACGQLIYGIFGAKFFTTAITIGIYFLLESKIGMYRELYWIMIIFFLAQLVDFTWFFQGIEEFAFIVTRNVLVKVVGIICIFVFVKETKDVGIYALIIQGTTLLGNLIVVPCLRKFIVSVPIKCIRILPPLKGGMIYFIPTIATSVYTMLDKAMIGWVTKSSYENGYYEQAYKIIQIALVAVTSLRTVTLPRVVHLYNEKNYGEVIDIVNRTIRFVLCLSLPMCIGLILIAPRLIPIFLGDSFGKSIIIVQVLAVLIVVLGLSTLISGQCLTAMERQKQANVCVIVGAVINFSMNLVLIPKCGALGAAIATVVSEIIILVMFLIFGRTYIRLNDLGKYFCRYLSGSLIMAAVIYAMEYVNWNNAVVMFAQVFTGVIIYFAVLILARDDMILSFLQSFKQRISKSN